MRLIIERSIQASLFQIKDYEIKKFIHIPNYLNLNMKQKICITLCSFDKKWLTWVIEMDKKLSKHSKKNKTQIIKGKLHC